MGTGGEHISRRNIQWEAWHMSRKPEFITFTGADDHTSVRAMVELSRHFPIEWGILFSPSRQGKEPRYPCDEAISRFTWATDGIRMAAHLCGAHSRAIMAGEDIKAPADFGFYQRIQVNHGAPDPKRIGEFRLGWGPRCIAQSRDLSFPKDTSLDWLFDTSGGRGAEPALWAHYPHPPRLVGYAGGIGPHNVLSVIDAIDAAGPYWIDMESGVRTEDRFDIDLCRKVCAQVYGAALNIQQRAEK